MIANTTVICPVWSLQENKLELLRGHLQNLRNQTIENHRVYVLEEEDTESFEFLTAELKEDTSAYHALVWTARGSTMWEALAAGIEGVKTDYVMNLNMDDRLAVDSIGIFEAAMVRGADLAGGEWDVCYSQMEADLPFESHVPDRLVKSEWPPPAGEVCCLGSSQNGTTFGPSVMWKMSLHKLLGTIPTRYGDNTRIRLLGDLAWWDLIQRSGLITERIPVVVGNYMSSPTTQLEFRFDNRPELQLFDAYGVLPYPKLSILVCGLAKRAEAFRANLLPLLHVQLEQPGVEVIIDVDNGEKTVGHKRNDLVKKSRGEFVAFVDDDDEIPANYAETVLQALRGCPDTVTHCELWGTISTGEILHKFHHSTRYSQWSTGPVDGIYQRPPNHLNPIRRNIAIRCSFPAVNMGEDRAYSEQVLPMLREEAPCSESLYFYTPSTDEKVSRNEEQEAHGVSMRDIMRHSFTQKIIKRSRQFTPSLVIAQPRRSIREMPIQKLWEFGSDGHVMQPFGVQVRYISIEGKPVDIARNQLIGYAVTEGFKYMLFVDDDTAIPCDAVQQLMQVVRQGHPVVTGIVTQKFMRRPITMLARYDNEVVQTPDTSPADALIDINWITGLACCMIDVEALRKMVEKDPMLPPCVMGRTEDGSILFGEDFFFSQRLLEAGVPIVADRSVQCLHVEMKTGNYWCHPDFHPDLNRYRTTIELKERNTFL